MWRKKEQMANIVFKHAGNADGYRTRTVNRQLNCIAHTGAQQQRRFFAQQRSVLWKTDGGLRFSIAKGKKTLKRLLALRHLQRGVLYGVLVRKRYRLFAKRKRPHRPVLPVERRKKHLAFLRFVGGRQG